MFLCFRTTDFF